MVTVLGRPENIEMATGFHRVSVAGVHPWQPACVVDDDGSVHLLPFTWDRERLAESVLAVVGDTPAIVVDGITPWWRERLGQRLTITAEPWPNRP